MVKGLPVCLLFLVVGRLQGEYQEKYYDKINKAYTIMFYMIIYDFQL